MSWWLIGILAYLFALGAVLLLAGGVRRGDRLHIRAAGDFARLSEAERPEPGPRSNAPRRPAAPGLRPARRALGG